MTFVDPLDRTHLECLEARDWIRDMVAAAIDVARHWTPQPCPTRQETNRA